MRIVLKEVKKMFTIKSVLLLSVFTLLFFLYEQLPQAFDGRYYTYNRDSDNYERDYAIDLYIELISKAGPSLSPDEAVLLDDIEAKQCEILDSAVAQYGELADAGITTYKELENIVDTKDENNRELYNKCSLYLSKIKYRSDDVTYHKAIRWLEEIEYIKNDLYWNLSEEEVKNRLKSNPTWSEWYREHMKELYSRDEYSLLYHYVRSTSFTTLTAAAVWSVICCMLIILPYQVRERLSRVKGLSASCKIGRHLYFRRWIAVVITCVLVALVNLSLVALLFCRYGYTDFLSCSNATARGGLAWIEMSFGIHLLIGILLIIVFTIAVGTIFFIASEVNGYVAAIALGVPCCALFYGIANEIFSSLFEAYDYYKQDMKLFEVWVVGAILLFAMDILGIFITRNRVMEIHD